MLKDLFRKKSPQILGLDIGSRMVKAVLIVPDSEGYEVRSCACETVTGNPLVEREVKDFESLSTALRKVKLALKEKVRNVAIGVSGSSVITKLVYMDAGLSDSELETQIELEADSLIPYPLDEVYLDFEEVGDSQAAEEKVDVLLCAAHKDMVDSRVTLLREVELEPKVVDVEGYALANALHHFAPLPEISDEESDDQPLPIQLCVNVGNSLMTLVAVQDGRVLYTKEHQFGTDVLLQDLAIMNSLDKPEAERQLMMNELPVTWRQDSLPQFVSNLSQQINRALQMYASACTTDIPDAFMISGGAACIEAIDEEIGREMNKTVTIFNPFADLKISEQAAKQGASRIAPAMAIAMGLASRGFHPWHI